MKFHMLMIALLEDGTPLITINQGAAEIPSGTKIYISLLFKNWYYADVVKRAILTEGAREFIERNWNVKKDSEESIAEEEIKTVEEEFTADTELYNKPSNKKKKKDEKKKDEKKGGV